MGLVTMIVPVTAPVKRFDVFLVALDPTLGSEIQKTRPCLVVSPDESNRHIGTVIVAPMTSGGHVYSTRIACVFAGKSGFIVLDQLRTVDKMRLMKHLGRIAETEQKAVLLSLSEMFAE